ncbi:MAG: polymerase [Parcubacteria group bacterium]|nr:polymerase [Parcubacteria group bacterium]
MSKTILHIDGDSFFASCEISLNHKLKGKPVVTGQERGIATAMSPEAKALGVSRGMPVFRIRKELPQVIITHSNYTSYGIFAQRMYDIVRRYTPLVEEYSIDECFADITLAIGEFGAPEALGKAIKEALNRELGMTFSVGIGPSKVLAKVASKWQKPNGLTVIKQEDVRTFLKDVQIGKIWGIGPQTTLAMQSRGIQTGLDFIEHSKDWVAANFARPIVEIWHELQGMSVHRVNSDSEEDQSSIQCTRTFTPPTQSKIELLSELSKNVEGACVKARRQKLCARRIHYFLKTQEFRYKRKEIMLVNPVSSPADIMHEINKSFDEIFRSNTTYRATGVTLAGLVDDTHIQTDLFGGSRKVQDWARVFEALDKVDKRFGSHTLMLGSSLRSLRKYKKIKKVFRIPSMGEVN